MFVTFRKEVASFNKEVISFKKEGYPLLPEINMRHEKGLWHAGKVGQSIFFVEGWREKKLCPKWMFFQFVCFFST